MNASCRQESTGNHHLFECRPSVARHWKCVVLCGRTCTFTLQTVVGLQQFREAPLVCQPCVVRRFVGFPFDPFHWHTLAVHLGRPHERCVRRHCYVLKFVVFVWEIVGSAKFTVARLAKNSRQLPARPQSVLSVSQLASSSSVCCERCVCDGRVVICDGARALSLVVNPSLCLSAHNTNQHVVSTASR